MRQHVGSYEVSAVGNADDKQPVNLNPLEQHSEKLQAHGLHIEN